MPARARGAIGQVDRIAAPALSKRGGRRSRPIDRLPALPARKRGKILTDLAKLHQRNYAKSVSLQRNLGFSEIFPTIAASCRRLHPLRAQDSLIRKPFV
jgi:hypothetical protein